MKKDVKKVERVARQEFLRCFQSQRLNRYLKPNLINAEKSLRISHIINDKLSSSLSLLVGLFMTHTLSHAPGSGQLGWRRRALSGCASAETDRRWAAKR